MANEPSGVSIWSPHIANEALVRKFVSLNGYGYIAICIQDSDGNPVNADPGSLSVTLWFNDVIANPAPAGGNPYGTQIAVVDSTQITNESTGMYYYDMGPAMTANRGLITAVWQYTVNSVQFQFTDHLQVLDPMPLYDSLRPAERVVVEQVSWMFGDLFDSTDGGPHLLEEFQSHWNYERIAQMQAITVQRMNFIGNFGNVPTSWSVGQIPGIGSGQPWGYTYSVPSENITKTTVLPNGTTETITYATPPSTGGGTQSGAVPSQFQGLVLLGTYLECMRHLRDSYTEIPNRPGMDVAYTDRTAYQQRWSANLATEVPQWERAVKGAKMSLLGLSRGSLLVAGGIYGGSALGIFQAGTYSAQVRSWRFYPAAPAIMWGASH